MTTARVIIVNFNAGEYLQECIASVLNSSVPVSVTVADNASSDGSADALAERFGQDARVEILNNEDNLGFARAVNRVARKSREEFLLILNPDCVLDPEAIGTLMRVLEVDTRAGVAGPWVTDQAGKMQKGTWRRFPDPWRSLMTFTGLAGLADHSAALGGVDLRGARAPAGPIKVDAVSGACLMLRRAVAEKVGFYDEGYAMHCEDLDLMFRLRAMGYHCMLVPSARVIHRGGVSTASRPWWVHRQKHLGMQRYFRKFQSGDHALPVRWLVYTGIWCHYLATLPVVLLGRLTRPA